MHKMSINNPSNEKSTQELRESSSWTRTSFIAFEVFLVLILLVIWITSEGIRESKSLWVLFLYSFPSEFLIAIVPHEPVLLYFGKFFTPLTVAVVAGSSTLMTEALNYSVFKYMV